MKPQSKQAESYLKHQQRGREWDIFLAVKNKTSTELNAYTRNTGTENKREKANKFQNLRFQNGFSNVFLSEIKNVKCVLCKPNEYYSLFSCPELKQHSVKDRVENVKLNKLSFKCLNYRYCV